MTYKGRIPDNSIKNIQDVFGTKEENVSVELANIKETLSSFSGKKVGDFENLLLYPEKFGKHGDKLKELEFFSVKGDEISTGNLMGFVAIGDVQLTIHSRFSEGKDYFLHYLLQKVLSLNVFNFELDNNDESVWDFLPYLFPSFFNKAIQQGIFKKYQYCNYDDSKLKGRIDIANFIRNDIPFRGNVSYQTRELLFDNPMTQLVRHTIEFMKEKPRFSKILSANSGTKDAVDSIVFATPSYAKNNRQKIIAQNLKPVCHPYFTHWTALQKICLQILRHKNLSYGENTDKIHGVLFDGAWLWEEYLFSLMKELNSNYIHAVRGRKKGIHRFKSEKGNGNSMIYPDYRLPVEKEKQKSSIVLDAKYKRKSTNREDIFQILGYMFLTGADKGGLIYPPDATETTQEKEGEFVLTEKQFYQFTTGTDKTYHTFVFPEISKTSNDFDTFKLEMKEKEKQFKKWLKWLEQNPE